MDGTGSSHFADTRLWSFGQDPRLHEDRKKWIMRFKQSLTICSGLSVQTSFLEFSVQVCGMYLLAVLSGHLCCLILATSKME